jgi:hypothetical protein
MWLSEPYPNWWRHWNVLKFYSHGCLFNKEKYIFFRDVNLNVRFNYLNWYIEVHFMYSLNQKFANYRAN